MSQNKTMTAPDGNRTPLTMIRILLILVTILVLVSGFLIDLESARKYGAIDLRNRITGVRLVKDGFEPYFFKWDESTPDRYIDARDYYRGLPVSRLTVPPTVLMLHLPFADLPYIYTKYIFLFMQYLVLLLSLYMILVSKDRGSDLRTILAALLAVLFIAGSYIWRLHTDRSQLYICYLFLFTLSFFLVMRFKRKGMVPAGLVSGFLIALRFPYMIMLIPFILARKWRFILGAVAGSLTTVLISLVFIPFSSWIHYFKAMKLHGLHHLGYYFVHPPESTPKLIEGMGNLAESMFIHHPDTSVQGLLFRFAGIRFHSFSLGLMIVLVLVLLSFWLMKLMRVGRKDPGLLFLSGILMVMVTEYFLPAARYAYNNVIWLFPLTYLVMDSGRKIRYYVPILVIAGFLVVYPVKLKSMILLAGEYLMLGIFLAAPCLLEWNSGQDY